MLDKVGGWASKLIALSSRVEENNQHISKQQNQIGYLSKQLQKTVQQLNIQKEVHAKELKHQREVYEIKLAQLEQDIHKIRREIILELQPEISRAIYGSQQRLQTHAIENIKTTEISASSKGRNII